MNMRYIIGTFCLLAAQTALGHGPANPESGVETDRMIQFPDTAGMKTIVLDPHTHSVFSDGHVWPNIRIGEALRDGLDAIAITEHLEYQPHLRDIPHPDRNRSFEEASAAAKDTGLVVIAGSEITRDAPAGHMNALFIQDANKLLQVQVPDGPVDVREYYATANAWPAQNAVAAANAQGAFVFWNHAWWTRDFPNGIVKIPNFHKKNARAHLLHGIEIANGDSYSEEAFQIALDYNLTLLGVSDIHNLIDWDYQPEQGGHRPVTLVLAEDKSEDAIKRALFDRRTVVWFKNMLIGREEHLDPLLQACLTIKSASYPEGQQILRVTLDNNSDATFRLRNLSRYTFYGDTDYVEVPAHGSVPLEVKTPAKVAGIALDFEVLNALTAPKKNAKISLSSQVL